MTAYDRGNVILVEIAFSGAVGFKRRPAVVMSTGGFNRAGIKLIVAAITSNVSPPFRPGDTLLNAGMRQDYSSHRRCEGLSPQWTRLM